MGLSPTPWGGSARADGQATETPASATAPGAKSATVDSKTAAPTVTGLPKDLSVLSREELIDLVKDLTLQNQILAVKLVEQRDALATAAPDLQARIDWQARTIDRLQAKLKRVEDQASAAASVAPPIVPQTPDATSPAAEAAPDSPTITPAPDANPAWKYRFAYELGLIRTSGDGHIILRDENGKRQRHEYDYSEYRRDALWVNLLIRNDSDQPMRFAGLIELQGDQPFGRSARDRLATHAFRTPLLQPGEVFQIQPNELSVERPDQVDIIELTHVQAFSTPADPAPDPASR